jgi:hypothetical protein
MSGLQPTETQHRKITVKKFTHSNIKKSEVSSVSEAISEIKSDSNPKVVDSKIILEGEVVYYSDKHGDIENWETEWNRQKRLLSVDESLRDCPHNHTSCYEDDLCMDCQLDKAAGYHD